VFGNNSFAPSAVNPN